MEDPLICGDLQRTDPGEGERVHFEGAVWRGAHGSIHMQLFGALDGYTSITPNAGGRHTHLELYNALNRMLDQLGLHATE